MNAAFLLEPYDASAQQAWTTREAAHLLRRAQFGFTPEELDRATSEGLDATLQRLLDVQPESVAFHQAETALRQRSLGTGNIADLKIWWLYRMRYSNNPLLEKMTVFWHNHFATSNAKVNSVPYMLTQNELIRSRALDDFKQLLHGMSRDTAMLIWLDGNANRKRHPNENFAREVMELFALGVGNYTERDIQEASRAFTGWHVRDGHFWNNALQHDESQKTVFGQTGNFDGENIVNFCLLQPACPRFLAMKLLKTFVSPEPKAEGIEQLSNRIRQLDFNLKAVLRELFASQWFFQAENRHAIIKSPLDLILGAVRPLAESIRWPSVASLLGELGQDVFQPPSVKGWEGGRHWIAASMMLQRANFATEFTTTEKYGPLSQSIVNRCTDSSVELVDTFGRWLLDEPLDETIRAELLNCHVRSEGSPEEKLRALLQLMMTLPEYHLH